MSAALYTFVPFNGDRETSLANVSPREIVDNHSKQMDLYDQMAASGVDAQVWFTHKGVIVSGNKNAVREVANIVTAPSFLLNSGNENLPPVSAHFGTASMGPQSVGRRYANVMGSYAPRAYEAA